MSEARGVTADWLFDNFGKWLPMSRCVELAESHHAALASAGLKVLAREPTKEMIDAVRGATRGIKQMEDWRAMWDAAPTGKDEV